MLLNNKYLNVASCHTISIIVISFVITVRDHLTCYLYALNSCTCMLFYFYYAI